MESTITQLCIIQSVLPLNLASRYTSLVFLNLQQCTLLTPQALETLHGLPLTSLALALDLDEFSPQIITALRKLSQGVQLDIEIGKECNFERGLENTVLRLLEGCSVVRLHLYGTRIQTREDSLLPLRGMPLTDLKLARWDMGYNSIDIFELLEKGSQCWTCHVAAPFFSEIHI